MESAKVFKEKRRVHIVYFLSRMGQVEQPHLLRVRHLSDGRGVYLRDVKRWLADLRGKDMPQAFSWSYKRKYKTGYVWQDLVDDDLITPISDNEYVLQGSQLTLPIPSLFDSCSSQKKTPIFKEVEEAKLEKQKMDVKMENEPEKFASDQMNNGELSSICSSERSTISDEYDNSMKLEEVSKDLEIEKEGEEVERFKNQYSSLYSKLVNKKKKKMKDMDKDKDKEGVSSNSFSSSSTTSSSSTNSQSDSFAKSKSYSNGASTMLRHWITCGALDTNDTALIKNRFAKDSLNQPFDNPKNDTEICKGDKFGGSARVFRTCFDQQLEIHQLPSFRKSFDGGMDSRKKRQKDCSNGKMASATAYKPMAFPNCSQCGKTFRPEKLHAHMKSCRGLKSLAKTASNSDKSSSKSTTTTSNKESISGYLLTN